MTRAEYLDWTRQRALAYADTWKATASLMSDLTKHDETKDLVTIESMRRSVDAATDGPSATRKFINEICAVKPGQ